MGAPGEDEEGVVALQALAADASALPYTVELWDLARSQAERVIGRTASAMLARAVFTAAQTEYLGRLIVLRRYSKIIAQT